MLLSFGYALEGLKYTIVTQRNMRAHFLVSLIVLLLGLYLPLNKVEVLILFLCIAMVLFAELINTVMETIVDMVTQEYHPLAKVAKDVAAGAVLLTVGLAIIVGISIFYPYLQSLFIGVIGEPTYTSSVGLAGIIAFVFFLTLILKGWLHRIKWHQYEPSMTTSIAFCIAAMISLTIGKVIIVLLVYLLATMIMTTRYRMKSDWTPILWGAFLGTIVAIVGVFLLWRL